MKKNKIKNKMNKPLVFFTCLFSGVVIGSVAGIAITQFLPYQVVLNNKNVIELKWNKLSKITKEEWDKNNDYVSKIFRIKNDAFKNNTTLTSIYIPDYITEIEAKAFNEISSLIDIYMPKKLKHGSKNQFGLTEKQYKNITWY